MSRPAAPQQTVAGGRIAGQVLDAETGRPLPGAWLRVEGTSIEALAGVEGRYLLSGVPAGPRTVVVSSFGYAVKTVTEVDVTRGGAARLDITLEPSAVAVEGIVVTVTAHRERGSVEALLDARRNAVGVSNAIGAEEISRSPDGNAAEAIQRVSGVTVQDGRYVFVRGLGERYTRTSLNGARIPSPEPERKVVPLDLFPSSLIASISTSKSFTPDLPGDFSGAEVDIRTAEFPAESHVTFSTSAGVNSRATGRSVLGGRGTGLEWLALAAGRRPMPAGLATADFLRQPPTQEEINELVESFRNAWSTRAATGDPKTSFSLAAGGSGFPFGQQVGYLLSATYSRSEGVRDDQVRAQALPTAGGGTREIDRFEGSTGSTGVLWGGIFNLSTVLGGGTRLSLANTYNRTADDRARREVGFSENLAGLFEIHRLEYVERSIRSSQLAVEHQMGDRHTIGWSFASSGVSREEPDRSEIVYLLESDPLTGQSLRPAWFSVSNEGAVRTFAGLRESGLEGAVNYRLALGRGSRQHGLKAGGLARTTRRDTENRAFSVSASLDRAGRELEPEEIFDGRFTGPGDAVFRLTPLGVGGSYEADDDLFAGYAMLELAVSERLRLATGARLEHSGTSVETEPTVGGPLRVTPTYTDVLPALTLRWRPGERHNLHLAASQTLSRPEYRELAPVLYREVLFGDNVLGNPDLRRTLIQNADARWEWFPRAGEVLSVGAFAKRFDDPIEQVFLGTSGTRIITYANAEEARNVGVELEVRKRLDLLSDSLDGLTAFANATLMASSIRIGEGGASKTNDERRMVGQAPYVVNAGLTYASRSGGLSATLLYNVVGERIISAAEAPLPDIFERPRHRLDLSFRAPLLRMLSLKLDAENLLDEPYELTQGTVVREFYRTGRVFSTGFTWRL